jgi:hypothetical protein
MHQSLIGGISSEFSIFPPVYPAAVTGDSDAVLPVYAKAAKCILKHFLFVENNGKFFFVEPTKVFWCKNPYPSHFIFLQLENIVIAPAFVINKRFELSIFVPVESPIGADP